MAGNDTLAKKTSHNIEKHSLLSQNMIFSYNNRIITLGSGFVIISQQKIVFCFGCDPW